MNRAEVQEAVRKYRIIVALRGLQKEELLPAAEALYAGGIRMLELTFDQADPDRLRATPAGIALLKEHFGDRMHIGAGTVTDAEHAGAALDAGAEYLLAPNTDLRMIEAAEARDTGTIPGALTPTEICTAWAAGAALIKLFPVGNFGPSYVKAISAPLAGIPFLGMGGINETNMKDYLTLPQMAGIGIGAGIAKLSLIRAKDWDGLTALAERYTSQL